MDPPLLVNKAQGNIENNIGDSLALPSGPITRSRAKRYGAAMSLYIQDRVSQELKIKLSIGVV
ncbi:hypothetical protein JCGZ_04953 [Jatropha curcas]|uniref:Uncharacterized protein n=1 Tax=Jatropha curcas TaxID=180498 RepID=A0A067L5P3_JATCU|nr:hypothetical protein JCGZ_04953 [Jatropha curcas]